VADNDYLTDALTPDGSLVVIYTPIIRQFTVDMSQLAGPAAAHWFDPAGGVYYPVAGSPLTNSGTVNFTPPANNADGDGGWVLVLETHPPVIPPPPPPPPPQPQFLQQAFATPQSPQSQVAVAYPNSQTGGNVNIVAVGWNDATSGINAVSDSAGNVYQVAVPTFHGNGMSQAIYYATNIAPGGNTVTVIFNQPAAYVDLRVTEYSGLTAAGPFDGGTSVSGVGTVADSGLLSVSATNELLFGAGMTAGGFTGPGAGFTLRAITSPDGDILEDQISAARGAYDATAPLSGSTAWLMQLGAFNAAPAPASAPQLRIFLTATNTVVLAWSSNSMSFTLQQNSSLSMTNWVDVTNTMALVGGDYQVISPLSAGQTYYRLKYP
jgi:hypothetical protein